MLLGDLCLAYQSRGSGSLRQWPAETGSPDPFLPLAVRSQQVWKVEILILGEKNKQKRCENSLTGTSLTSPEMAEQRGGSEISQKGQTVSQGPHAEKTERLPKGDTTSWSWPWDSFKRLKTSKARAIWGGLCRTAVSSFHSMSMHRFFMVIQKHALVSAKFHNSLGFALPAGYT